jgi:hypothetical protein
LETIYGFRLGHIGHYQEDHTIRVPAFEAVHILKPLACVDAVGIDDELTMDKALRHHGRQLTTQR